MKVLILGGDGYLGWPTAMYLSKRGYEVAVVDNYFRRRASQELNFEPLIPVPNLHQRVAKWKDITGLAIRMAIGDIMDYGFLEACFRGAAFAENEGRKNRDWIPDAVVHYAEQPSAPYSMLDREKAIHTLTNNLVGTANLVHAVKASNPSCHIVKLGTMGVYGTPNIDIEEGYLEVVHNGRTHTFLYPKTPGSLYHLTKAQDGDLLNFYVRTWNLIVTDLNQGPVYGIQTMESDLDESLTTYFNYDGIFGTVLNRFLVQAACGFPLTIYGKGGQTRGYLNIKDTLACIELTLRHPPSAGTYRVFNQFVETFTVCQLANMVQDAGKELGLDVVVQHIENPRKELEEHYYNPKHKNLLDLGLKPHYLTRDALSEMLQVVLRHRSSVNPETFLPTIRWAKSC